MDVLNKCFNQFRRIIDRRPFFMLLMFWLATAVIVTVGDALTGKVRRDFAAYSLAASKTMFEGGDPYSREEAKTSYKYFPLNAMLFWPFTKMPLPLAQGLWTATNAALLVVCLWSHRRVWTRDMRVPWWVWALALAIGFRFFVKNLRLGQWNTSVYCLSFLGLTLIYRRREVSGAALTALAAALKYMPSFFAIYLLLRGRWRAALTVLVAMCFWILVFPTLFLGPQRHGDLMQRYWARASKQYQGMISGDYTSSLSLRSTVMRMTSEVKPRLPDAEMYDFTLAHLPKETARRLSEYVAYAVLLATMIMTYFVTRRERQLAASESTETSKGTLEHRAVLIELLLIGLWYTTFLMISPETRVPHFLTMFTPAFALSVAVANAPLRATNQRVVMALLIATIVLVLSGSEISEKAHYHFILKGLGSYAWGQVTLWGACIVALFDLILPRKTHS